MGIVAVHKSGKQLLQVTQGMAGSLDRAHAVAVKLAEYANKGKNKDWCSKKKMDLINDKALKVKKLGLDAEAAKRLRERREKQAKEPDRSNEPSPVDGLTQLRDRIVAARST